MKLKTHPRGYTFAEAAREFGYGVRALERAFARPRRDKKHLVVDTTSRPYRVTRNQMIAWMERNTI